MKTHTTFETPTKSEIDDAIERAQEMRAAYMAEMVRSFGLKLKALFARKERTGTATA